MGFIVQGLFQQTHRLIPGPEVDSTPQGIILTRTGYGHSRKFQQWFGWRRKMFEGQQGAIHRCFLL